MGNLLNRLFGSESRETGCKRPFSKHNKVNLHSSSSKSKFYVAYDGSASDESVLFCKSFKSPSVVNAMHRLTLSGKRSVTTSSDFPISKTFQESSSKAAAAASSAAVSPVAPNQAVISQEQPPVQEEPNSAHPQSDQPPSANAETSPFQRDFITSHQPLVSLEKSRPRRSNIRRSSRMNASIGKGDSATTAGAGRPAHGHHQQQLSSVSSIVADEDAVVVRTNNTTYTTSHPPGTVISNRADPSLPVVTHNNQSAPSQPTWLEQQQEIIEEGESLEPAVDELSPNERHKVAKSRISQMFIKREQTHKHISMIAPLELSRGGGGGLPEERTSFSANSSPTHLTTNGVFVNTEYERVYDNDFRYDNHYKAGKRGLESENENAEDNGHDEVDEGRSTSVHDQRKRVSSVDDDDEQAVQVMADGSTEGALASSAKPEVTPRRKHLMQGNPMLIDELKKRQSTLYQTTVE